MWLHDMKIVLMLPASARWRVLPVSARWRGLRRVFIGEWCLGLRVQMLIWDRLGSISCHLLMVSCCVFVRMLCSFWFATFPARLAVVGRQVGIGVLCFSMAQLLRGTVGALVVGLVGQSVVRFCWVRR